MPNNKLKILVINWQDIKNPFGGGAEVHLHEIFKRIAKMGHEVHLFSCEIDGEPKEEEIDGIKIHRKGNRNTFNFGVKKEYNKRFSKDGFDIVIDDINKIPFYTPRFVKEPLLAISHHFFGTSIFREASLPAASYVYTSEKIMNYVYKKTQFAVVSQSTLDDFIKKGFNKDNFTIITNAIAHEEYPMKVSEKADNPTVTYFGRLKKYKSVDHLIKAFALVKEKIPNAKLEIIGKGDFMNSLKELAKFKGVDQDVTFHGFVSNEKKIELLSKSHLMVNTSMKEGWGITNIEANACGTPVLSANVPGLKDSVKSGLSGDLYEYGNIEELAKKIDGLLSNKERLEELSNGSIVWASQFSWDKSANEMIESIKKVINS